MEFHYAPGYFYYVMAVIAETKKYPSCRRRIAPAIVSSGAPGGQLVYADYNGKAMGWPTILKALKCTLERPTDLGRLFNSASIKNKSALMDNDSVLERFDGELFGRLIEKVMVTSLVEVTFVFKTGAEVSEVLVD